MPRLLALFLTLITFPLLAGDAPVATILGYHEVHPREEVVSRTPRRSAMSEHISEKMRYVAPLDSFVEQLDYLEANGYHVIPLADLVDHLSGRRDSLPPRAVVITFDDGWLCTYTTAWPELKKRGMPFTAFVYPGLIVQHGSHTVKWSHLEKMAADGVDIESHSWSHPFLTRKHNHQIDAAQYHAFLDHELLASRTRLEKASSKPVRFLAYPYGDYDRAVVEAAMRDGYTAAVTTRRGPITRRTPSMELRRYLVHNDTSIEEFRSFLLP